MMNLFQSGDFTLHSGEKSTFKIECDALGAFDWATLAMLAYKMTGPFGQVFGVPRGGFKLSEQLWNYANSSSDRVLIVDDVLTTGESMEKLLFELITRLNKPEHLFTGVVVFARSECPDWVRAINQMPRELWSMPYDYHIE